MTTTTATKTTKSIARTHLEQKYVLKVVLKYLPTKKDPFFSCLGPLNVIGQEAGLPSHQIIRH
jgi:hypothetical protein